MNKFKIIQPNGVRNDIVPGRGTEIIPYTITPRNAPRQIFQYQARPSKAARCHHALMLNAECLFYMFCVIPICPSPPLASGLRRSLTIG